MLALTFSRIDINPRPVEHLLILPVAVPHDSFDAEQKHQGGAAVHQHRPEGPAPQPHVQGPHPHRHQQAEAHAGDVQDPLRYHKAHVEEQVSGREEGDRQQAQREHHHVLRGGQWSPDLIVLLGTILSTVTVRACVGIVRVFMIVQLVTVSIAVSVFAVGVMMGFAVRLPAFSRVVRPQAKPSQ